MSASAVAREPGAFRRRALRDGLVISGLLAAVYFYGVLGDGSRHALAEDGLIYWAVDPSAPYVGATVGGVNAYLYSPAFAQVFWLIGHLPREVFIIGWTALIGAAAAWLAWSWPAALLILLVPVAQDVLIGNIHVLLATAIVLGFRWPAAWAFVLLTKVTPGIGLLWFAVRREWRHLMIALFATGSIAAVSLALAPGVWADWIHLLRGDGSNESSRLLPRLALAAGIVIWGGLTDRAWTVPLASLLAMPVIWSDSFAMLLGCVAVHRYRHGLPPVAPGRSFLASTTVGGGANPAPQPEG